MNTFIEQKKAESKRKDLMKIISDQNDTKGNLSHSGLKTVKDLIAGVIGGGLTGAVIGKPSLIVGLGTSLAGYYFGSSIVSALGIGMMASGGHQLVTKSAEMSLADKVKERVKTFGGNLKERFYLDKIPFLNKKPEIAEETTEGIGSVQYFKYPELSERPLDMSGLDQIEKQIEESARKYERQTEGIKSYENSNLMGDTQDFEGTEDRIL